jgi:hypothetical protein
MSLSDKIQEAKQRIPLPRILHLLGLGHLAKGDHPSPFRDGDNKHCFGIFQKTDGQWNWKDQVTGDFGDEIDFIAKMEGLSPEDATAKFLHMAGVEDPPVNGNHKFKASVASAPKTMPSGPTFDWEACVTALDGKTEEIAQSRGYSVEFVEALRANKLIGMHAGQVAFPVADSTGNVVACHYRKSDGKGWRFEPQGNRVAPLVIGNPAKAKEIYVFESQWDALAVADNLGWHEARTDAVFIATRGASNGKLVAGMLNPEARIVLFPQNDKPLPNGKVPAEDWAKDVAAAAGEAPLFRVAVPKEHKDANDWIRAGIEEKQLRDAIARARNTSEVPDEADDLPPILSWGEFDAAEIEEPTVLVEGLLHKGSKMVLGGGSKSFKTWSLAELAYSVSLGQPWWGHRTTRHRVLYVNLEVQKYFFRNRVRAIAEARGVKADVDFLSVWNLRGHATDLDRMLPGILGRTRGKNFGAIIIDPAYKLMGDRDENSAGDIASFLNGLERLTVETGAAVVFGAHFSKGNQSAKDAIDRVSGSGVFGRDPDAILTMTRHAEEECFTVESILRNFPPQPPLVVEWKHPLMVARGDLDPTNLKQAKKPTGNPKYHPDRVAEVLEGEMSLEEWCAKAMLATGMSRRTFFDKLKVLKDAGRIKINPTNQKYWRVQT